MIAYLIGGILYARFSERIMLFIAVSVWILAFLSAVFLPSISPILFNISMIGIGLAYSLYVIGKNTLIGREIATSTFGSSTIWAFTTIIFIVFLIAGTIVGAMLWEKSDLSSYWIIYFIVILLSVGMLLFFTETKRSTSDFHFSMALYKRFFVRYGIFMIGLACFWQISVEASQVAINYSKEVFEKSNSVSSLLLIFSSIGAIIGNILSVKLSHKRLESFVWMTSWFVAIVFLFSTFLGLAKTFELYSLVQWLAFAVGFFFGWSVNLAESYFFSLLGSDPDEAHISALYGFTLSFVGAIMMFLAEKILHTFSYSWISVFMGILWFIALYGGWKGITIKRSH
jgi:MFS family permease